MLNHKQPAVLKSLPRAVTVANPARGSTCSHHGALEAQIWVTENERGQGWSTSLAPGDRGLTMKVGTGLQIFSTRSHLTLGLTLNKIKGTVAGLTDSGFSSSHRWM